MTSRTVGTGTVCVSSEGCSLPSSLQSFQSNLDPVRQRYRFEFRGCVLRGHRHEDHVPPLLCRSRRDHLEDPRSEVAPVSTSSRVTDGSRDWVYGCRTRHRGAGSFLLGHDVPGPPPTPSVQTSLTARTPTVLVGSHGVRTCRRGMSLPVPLFSSTVAVPTRVVLRDPRALPDPR